MTDTRALAHDAQSSSKVLLIAEVGSTHDGSLGNALRLIDAAHESGADVVKFQLHLPQHEMVRDAPNPPHFSAESRWDYLTRTSFTREQWITIRSHALSAGIGFIASAFSVEAVAYLEELGVDWHKVPSGEVSNIPMLEALADTGKHVFLSSGMSGWDDLDAAVRVLRNSPLTILQCSSLYPCPAGQVGLNVLDELKARYDVPVGLSDHSTGFVASIAAVALGARVIEKHMTLSRWMYGSDAPYSLEPEEFRQLADGIAQVREHLKPVDKDDVTPFLEMKRAYEKSIVAARRLPAGTSLGMSDLCFKKPGGGLAPGQYKALLGRVLSTSIERDDPIDFDDLEPLRQ